MNYKHGKTRTRLYRIWQQMKNRCFNKKTGRFRDYGGRGITVCDKWKNDFQAFYDWAIANGYSDDLTIDRIDNDLGYSPNNCRWATALEQSRNSRQCDMITYKGKTHCLKEWSEILGLSYIALKNRKKYGWTVKRMLETPIRCHKLYEKTLRLGFENGT